MDGGTEPEDGMGDDMDEGSGPGGGGQKGRGVDSVDHVVGTPATGPSLVEQVHNSYLITWQQ